MLRFDLERPLRRGLQERDVESTDAVNAPGLGEEGVITGTGEEIHDPPDGAVAGVNPPPARLAYDVGT